MTKVISYANIALNFTADTGGIYNVRSEISQLTRQAKSQMSELEKFIHQLRVISDLEKKGQYSVETYEQMRRVASNAYLDMAKKSGEYTTALQHIGGLVPKLKSEVDQLSFAYQRNAEASEIAAKKEERRAQLLQMVGRISKEHIRLSQERDALIASAHVKDVLAQQDAIARKQAAEEAYIAKKKKDYEVAIADMYVKETLAAQDAIKRKQEAETAYIAKKKREHEDAVAAMYMKEVLAEKEARRKQLEAWLAKTAKEQAETIKLNQEREKLIANAHVKEVLAAQDAIKAQDALIAKKRASIEASIAQKHVNDIIAAQDRRRLEIEQMIERIKAERFRSLTSHLDYQKFDWDRFKNQNMKMFAGMTTAELAAMRAEATRLHSMSARQLEVWKRQADQVAKVRAEFARMNREASNSRGMLSSIFSGLSMGGIPGSQLVGAGVLAGTIAAAAITIQTSLSAFGAMRMEMARLEVQMGSTEIAFKKFNQMRTIAAKSPLMTNDLLKGSVTLNQYGFEIEELIPNMKMLMDVSAGNADRFRSLALAYGQARAAGRLMGQETLQFINAGWNPLKTVARETGIEFSRLKKLMEEGKVSFDTIADALYAETQPGGKFSGMTEKLSGEYTAKVNKFNESLLRMKETLGELAAGPTGQLLSEWADKIDSASLSIMSNLTLYRAGLAASNGETAEMLGQVQRYFDMQNTATDKIAERKNLFKDIKKLEEDDRKKAGQEEARIRQKEIDKAAEKIKDLDGVAKKERELIELQKGKRELDLFDFEQLAKERTRAIMERDRIEDGKLYNEAKNAKARIDQMNKEIDAYKKIYDQVDRVSKLEEKRKMVQDSAKSLLDSLQTPEQKLNNDIGKMAVMIQMGLITQKQAMMAMENQLKDKKKESGGELPNLIKAGTIEAYQAIYGQRAMIQEQQLEQQKKQKELQEAGNKLLAKIAGNLETNLMGLVD